MPQPGKSAVSPVPLLSIFLLLWWLGGCSPFVQQGIDEPMRVYVLESGSPPGPPRLDPGGPALVLGSPRAAPGFSGSQMIYVQETHRLDAFAYHRWADAPALMLEPLLVQALEAAGLFSAVSDSASRVRAGLRLDWELLRLQQVFAGGGSEIDMAVRFALVDANNGRQLLSRVIAVREPSREQGPYGGVVAANRAVGRLTAQLQELLGRALMRE